MTSDVRHQGVLCSLSIRICSHSMLISMMNGHCVLTDCCLSVCTRFVFVCVAVSILSCWHMLRLRGRGCVEVAT
jgi:hypothetical protein